MPEIVFQDEHLLLLFKPPGWFVHPPENPKYRRGLKRHTLVQWLKDNYNVSAFPAHRLDFATEGILIFGKDRDTTASLNLQFKNHETFKTYRAVVRGWMPEPTGTINLALESARTKGLVECETFYRELAKLEVPKGVGKKFNTSRYSLLEVNPRTGRWHQIRRHMNRVAHPIIGDREHGDGRHNVFFRDELKIDGLCLWAKELLIRHPISGEKLKFNSPKSERFQQIENLFSFKPE